MQLGRCAAALLAGVFGAVVSAPARAQVDASARITVFSESSKTNEGIQVLHPQGDVSAAIAGTAHVSAGYSLDAVSGATPGVFGPRTGLDAVSGATKFSDTRHEAHGGFDVTRGGLTFGGAYSYARESDYRSHAVTGTAKADLIDRNFTLALSFTHNFDSVCDANNAGNESPLDNRALASSSVCFDATSALTRTRKLTIDAMEPSLTWIATPTLVLQFGTSLQVLQGFQSNPYRAVLVGSQHRTPQEHLPDLRQRVALFLRGVQRLPARMALMVSARAYRDTWAVDALTGEAELRAYLLPQVLVAGRGRYHIQRGAIFYRDSDGYRSLGPAGAYWTGDRELAPMSNAMGGGRLSYVRAPGRDKSVMQSLELSVKIDYLRYFLDDKAPNADRTSALIGQIGLSVRF